MAANLRLRCFLNVRVAPRHPPRDASRHNRQPPSLLLLYPSGQRTNDSDDNGMNSTALRYAERQHSCIVLDAGTEAFE